jgi:hypothetical protein
MRSMALRLGLLAAIGIGGVALAPYLMGDVADLKVGDCFDPPTEEVEVAEVQRHPCTDAHTGEVIYVGTYPGADDAPFPGDQAFLDHIRTVCVPAFEAYTGLDYESDPTWDFGFFTPTAAGWAQGDRGISCHASRIDGATTSGSLRVAS